MKEIILRIQEMERLFHILLKAKTGSRRYFDVYEKLRQYYEGPSWRADFEADESGLLPKSLCRGVLSEDALYNLLEEWDSVIKKDGEMISLAPEKETLD